MLLQVHLAIWTIGLAASASSESSPPKGHLERFGAWTTPEVLETRAPGDFPSAEEFYEKYQMADNKNGLPVIFKGATLNMTATKWDEQYLRENYGNTKVAKVEWHLKETRMGGEVRDLMNKPMKKFLDVFKKKDIYMVTPVPEGMNDDVEFMPFMNCGGHLNYLDQSVLWMSRGGTRSVVHYDDQDNLHCQLTGRKTFVLMHPDNKPSFEAHPNKKANGYGWVDTDLDQNIGGYGAFMGGGGKEAPNKLDVEAVDLLKFPKWAKVKTWELTLEPGDCFFLPFQWYHHAFAPAHELNIGYIVWFWRPIKYIAGPYCDEDLRFTYGDCSFGYEPKRGGHFGGKEKSSKTFTKCDKERARRRRDSQREEL